MENRKLIILFSLFLSLTFSGQVFAYEVGTHAFLTKEVLSFYKKNFPNNSIPEEFEKAIIEGSAREDDSLRWMNHFYDPVYNRGLTLPGNWLSSKEWARNDVYQTSITYNPIMRTTIADLLAVTNPEALRTTDYTWERAIKDYLKGDKERAFRGLGQVLHLIEDASVPDHTRNDPHPALNHEDALETGSPYEIWTSNFTPDTPDGDLKARLSGKKPIILGDLNAYFDGMAKYSNNNFYSRDTIGLGEYKSPEPDYFGLWSDLESYGFKKDLEFGDYKLLRGKGLFVWVSKQSNPIAYPKIISDYWSRLSVKAVQHGGGVIDLFFKEVEKAKNDPNFVIKEEKSLAAQVAEVARSWVANVLSVFGVKSDDDLKLVAEIPLANNNNSDKNDEPVKLPGASAVNDEQDSSAGLPQDEDAAERQANIQTTANLLINSGQVNINLNSAAPAPSAPAPPAAGLSGVGQGEVTFKKCSYNVAQSPKREKLIFNEIAWMGGLVSANDEWLELKNISGGELNLSGWQILDKDEQVKITFANGKKLAVGELLLLERTNDASVPDVVADLVYVGALSNTDEGLRLFDNNCVLVDEVVASPDWPAGESAARKTMERSADLSWHTYSGNGENGIFGTPKKENSPVVISQSGAPPPPPPPPEISVPAEPSAVNHLVISEVQITGGTGQTTNDFIELYNPTEQPVNLNGYRLVKRTKTGTSDTSIKSWTSDSFIPAKGFYLWANSNYTGIAVTPDATTTQSIANDNGVALRQGAEDTGTIIDSVAWGEAQNVFVENAVFGNNPGANQSLERKAFSSGSCVSAQGSGEFLGHGCDTNNNSSDLELRSAPNPQNSQNLPEPRSAPAAVQNFNAAFSSSTMELILSWGEATSSPKYILNHGTSSPAHLKPLAELIATTTYQFKINEVGAVHYVSIAAKDSDGLIGSTTVKEFSVASPLTNLYFYKDTRSTTSQKYLLDFHYNNYPFIPDIYQSGAEYNWKILVFYLNQEASTELELNTVNNWQPDSSTSSPQVGVLDIRYPDCTGGNSQRYSLVLPDNASRCSNGGGVENHALHWDNLEDLHLLAELATSTSSWQATTTDFVSAGAYALYQSGGGDQKFKLAALDRNKYYFQDAAPTHLAPEQPDDLELSFNENTSLLRIIWDRSRDSDTLDGLIAYEINYATGTLSDSGWIAAPDASLDPGEGAEVNGRPFTKISVEPDTTYNIALRAKDDFGNISSSTDTAFEVPDVFPPYDISNIQWGYVNDPDTLEVSFEAEEYPFMNFGTPSAILFFLNQPPPASYSFSNNAARWEIGGANSVLKLEYSTCQYGTDSLLGGLLMHNEEDCLSGGSGLKKSASRNDFVSDQGVFPAKISGVLENGGTTAHTFSASDYITLGFYELQGNTFQEAAIYNKKTYFQEYGVDF